MVFCPLFPCWDRRESYRKPRSLKEAKSIENMIETTKSISATTTTATPEWCRSLSANAGSDRSYANLTLEFDDDSSEKGSAGKPKIGKYHSVDTLSELKTKTGTQALAAYLQQRSNIPRLGARYPILNPFIGIPAADTHESTILTDWDEFYDGDPRMSTYDPSNLQRVFGSELSDNTCFNVTYARPRLSSETFGRTVAPVQKMPVGPGMVFAMLLTNNCKIFQNLNLGVSLQEVVDTFLKAETGENLPVSFTLSTDTRPKLLPAKKMAMTLSENLKGYLDEATQGLSFFVGAVNQKLCYKMSVCDLEELQKMFSKSCNQSEVYLIDA